MILQAMLLTMLASQAPATPNTQPIVADTSAIETSTGTIDAIDQTSRMVTVKYDDGTSADLHAGPKVTRFDQLKVGQRVTFRYYESTAYQVRKAGSPAPPATDQTALTPRAGDRPGGTLARQDTASVTVLAVNPDRPSITVKSGDGHTSTHLVKDKRHLVGVAAGDHVDITYTTAVLASVEPASDRPLGCPVMKTTRDRRAGDATRAIGWTVGVGLLGVLGLATPARAQTATPAPEQDVTALAKATQNPVGDLISVPFQFNFNTGGDLEDRTYFNLNIQPVIPFSVSADWKLIARLIAPIDSAPGPSGTRYSGLGDIQAQAFFTPARVGSVIWGVGPVFSLPTATASPVETGTWAAGVGVVVVKNVGPFVLGGLVSQLWPMSDAGDDPETNLLTVQPFVNYNFGKGWALGFAPVITANWDADSGQQWTVPLGIGITRTTVFNRRPMSVGVQYYDNAKGPDGAAGKQIRFSMSLLYPKTAPR